MQKGSLLFCDSDQSVEPVLIDSYQEEDSKWNVEANIRHDNKTNTSTPLLVDVNEFWELCVGRVCEGGGNKPINSIVTS